MNTNFNIQALRAFAAYGVVGHHIIFTLTAIGNNSISLKFGSIGVPLFFVISGYIMMITTANGKAGTVKFIFNRICRIVPIYWILTTVTILLVSNGFEIFGHTTLSTHQLLASFLFFPEVLKNGVKVPLLYVGWTLNFEMMFYTLFAFCLLIGSLTVRIYTLVGVICCIWLAAQLSDENPYIRYFGADITLAFALGVLLWPLSAAYPLRRYTAFLVGILALLGLGSLEFFDFWETRHIQLIVSIACAAMVYAAISLEQAGLSIGRSWLSDQGDASYSLYLIHPFVLQVVGKIAILSGLKATGLFVIVVGMFVSCGMVAAIFHHTVESPINRFLKRQRRKRTRF